MPAAARVGDPTGHPGVIAGPGMPMVLIGGQPAAVLGDSHVCGMPTPAGPHPPSPIASGSATVLIGGKPAARVGDLSGCGAPIVAGMPLVEIGA
jgi:uncharacterized Zn-binding protein involved in type VI secretion